VTRFSMSGHVLANERHKYVQGHRSYPFSRNSNQTWAAHPIVRLNPVQYVYERGLTLHVLQSRPPGSPSSPTLDFRGYLVSKFIDFRPDCCLMQYSLLVMRLSRKKLRRGKIRLGRKLRGTLGKGIAAIRPGKRRFINALTIACDSVVSPQRLP
jgi:hypothetical protein